MLVVLEGLDGAGKSTQVKRLRTYLEQIRPGLEYIHFPRYDAPVYGDLISRFLRGDFGANDAVHPQLVALLFAEDRHGAAPFLRERLEIYLRLVEEENLQPFSWVNGFPPGVTYTTCFPRL